ncbi:MAG: hypothetical protein HYX57_08325 [Chloroflexi bacterium]|nr:hypothetical protein [Chloroflexota bacterium]
MVSAVLDFRPSRDGFPFANRFPPGPAIEWRAGHVRVGIGEVGDGLCGGMCRVAADRFLRGDASTDPGTEEGPTPPPPGTPLFAEIVRQQVDSLALGSVPFRFWWAATRLRSGRWSAREQVREWRAIRRDIDAGRPAMLGLVRSPSINPFALTLNHQVLGYGYDATPDRATIRIYDPNHPGADDVAVELRRPSVAADAGVEGEAGLRTGTGPGPGAAVVLRQSTGEPLLALLRLPYRPAPAG